MTDDVRLIPYTFATNGLSELYKSTKGEKVTCRHQRPVPPIGGVLVALHVGVTKEQKHLSLQQHRSDDSKGDGRLGPEVLRQ